MNEDRAKTAASWAAAGMVGAVLALAVHAGPLTARRLPSATVEDVKALIRTRYVGEVADRELEYQALRGLAGALDPYSAFLSPEEARVFRDDTDGALSGIGIEITIEKGYLTVIAPLEDTPAWHAGILPGDRIIEIDGKPFEVASADEAARLIKGKPDTPVTLTVIHEGGSRSEELTIVRKRLTIPSVKRPRILDAATGVGYVRLVQFGPRTADELGAAIATLLEKGMRALVLDLRQNPGGHLDTAVGVADLFLDSGAIVRTESRDPAQVKTYEAAAPGTLPPFPLAVLVNGSSASASEIVAGALRDSGRAILVGTRTYGKGSVQTLIPLEASEEGEALLKITTARYYTRSGRPIQRPADPKKGDVWGIDPHIEVELDSRRLAEIFRARASLDARETVPGANGKVDVPTDPQLDAAVRALLEKLGSAPAATAK